MLQTNTRPTGQTNTEEELNLPPPLDLSDPLAMGSSNILPDSNDTRGAMTSATQLPDAELSADGALVRRLLEVSPLRRPYRRCSITDTS
jgi:hypothetical protein